jgi:8-amino-7-oxononanoate synthase
MRQAAMLDFTSALYLGFRHPSASLGEWDALTLGRPAALQEPPEAAGLAAELAALQGCEAAALAPSTLHLFLDLFGILGGPDAVIYIEAMTYAIARWGVQCGASPDTPVCTFPSGDATALERLLCGPVGRRRRPLIVCDALWPGSDRQPPLARYADLAARHRGYLVLDDTQGLGVLGACAGVSAPLGRGGGGSLRYHGLRGAHVIVGASLAKGFGVPMAVLSCSASFVRRFEEGSQTRVHASPPSAAVINAARRALTLNRYCGDRLRLRLCRMVRWFRGRVTRSGLRLNGGVFPVQSLAPMQGIDAAELHAGLLERQVRTVLQAERGGARASLSFILNAAQTPECIDRAINVLAETIRALRRHAAVRAPIMEVP